VLIAYPNEEEDDARETAQLAEKAGIVAFTKALESMSLRFGRGNGRMTAGSGGRRQHLLRLLEDAWQLHRRHRHGRAGPAAASPTT
jgi:hypothetical protein